MRISFFNLKFSDSDKKIYVKPLAGRDQVTTLGSNVTLAWVCHVQGNHTIDRLEWSLRLHAVTNKSRIALMYYSPETFWIDLTKSVRYKGRVIWTGKPIQGKISFAIQDVKTSDAQSYQIRWKVIIPSKNSSVEVVRRTSYLSVTVAGN